MSKTAPLITGDWITRTIALIHDNFSNDIDNSKTLNSLRTALKGNEAAAKKVIIKDQADQLLSLLKYYSPDFLSLTGSVVNTYLAFVELRPELIQADNMQALIKFHKKVKSDLLNDYGDHESSLYSLFKTTIRVLANLAILKKDISGELIDTLIKDTQMPNKPNEDWIIRHSGAADTYRVAAVEALGSVAAIDHPNVNAKALPLVLFRLASRGKDPHVMTAAKNQLKKVGPNIPRTVRHMVEDRLGVNSSRYRQFVKFIAPTA